MQDVLIAIGLGAASGIAGVVAFQFRLAWLGWLALAPLTAAIYLYSPLAAGLAGSLCGVLLATANRLGSVPHWMPRARMMEAGGAIYMALGWGVVFAVAAWLWPDGVPAWGVLIMPAAVLVLGFPSGIFTPHYMSWFLGSQATAPPVVHIARLGTEAAIPPLLALSATVPAMLLVQFPPSPPTVAVSLLSVVIVAGALSFGWASYRRAVGRIEDGPTVRVAAVACAPQESDPKSPVYRDVAGLIGRYEPVVGRARAQRAQLIVLPEHAAIVTNQTRERWLAAVSKWAKEAKARVVAGLLDEDQDKNQLVIADASGEIAQTYDKQHPARILGQGEPRRTRRMGPAIDLSDTFPVSAMICVDSDYSDMVSPVARAGGVLAVPTNDWEEIEDSHLRAAVWLAVMGGVPLVRANGHGISAVYDAAGRVVAQANSKDGPVLLVTDVGASRK